jgi:hypothetical protein
VADGCRDELCRPVPVGRRKAGEAALETKIHARSSARTGGARHRLAGKGAAKLLNPRGPALRPRQA